MDCKEFQDLLIRWADGELGSEEEKLISNHTDHCDDCRRDFDNYRSAVQGLRSLPSKPLDPGFATRIADACMARNYSRVIVARDRFRARSRWLTAAAAAAALILGLVLGRLSLRRPAVESTTPSNTMVVNTTPTPDSNGGGRMVASAATDESDMYVQAVEQALDQHELDHWNAQWMAEINEENPF